MAYQTKTSFVRPIRVRQSSGATIQGRFIWSPGGDNVAFNALGVARLHLPGGCQIHWLDSTKAERFGVIEKREINGEGLWSYRVVDNNAVYTVDERHLAPLSPACDDPLFLLRNLLWSSAGFFSRRAKFQAMRQRWVTQTQGMPGILGARIRPLPHQLAAVRRVLREGSPRFLLADEVGLGKTIEAGLILQALSHRNPRLKVLVVAPGAMSRQWLAELYLRFGAQVFKLLDQGIIQGFDDEAAESYLEQAVSWGRVIASASLLAERPQWFGIFSEANWDAVVIDEVHRYQSNSPLFHLLENLSRKSRVFLALSATPSRNDLAGLQDLLRLISPASDAAPLELQLAQRRDIWFAVHNTRQLLRPTQDDELPHTELCEALESLWSFLSLSDAKIAALLTELRHGSDRTPASRLLSYVQERYRIDHRLVRSRRQWVEKAGEAMARRRLEYFHHNEAGYAPDEAEKQLARNLSEFANTSELSQTGMLRAVLERTCLTSPRRAVDTLSMRQQALRKQPNSRAAETAFRRLFDEPEPVLEKRYLDTVIQYTPVQPGEKEWLNETLNWALFWLQQNPVPARFVAVANWLASLWKEKPLAAVLIFAQDREVVEDLALYLGTRFGQKRVGEFHAALPQLRLEEVARSFQRGSICVLVCDELGGEGRNFQHAEAVVHIDLPWSPSRVEQRIGRLDRIGRALERDVLSVVYCGPSELESAIFRMHRETFCVFDKSIGPVEFRLTALRNDLCSALVLGPAAVMALQPAILEAVTAAKAEDEELMDAALQLSQDEFEEGKELVDSLRRAPWQDWQQAATGWARELGIICEPQVNGTIRVQVKPDQMQVDVTGVSSLLKSGIYGTFSRKEALADESIHFFGPGHPLLDTLELLLDNSWLGRACIWKRNLGPANGRVYALFHLIYEPDFSLLGEQTGRAMVELAILRHYQQGTSHIAVALPNSEHPEYEVVGHELVRRMLDKASSLGALTVAELPQLGAPDFAYRLMLKVEQAQKETIKAFREQRRQVILETAKRFAHDVQSTIDALRNRIEEDDSAVAAREELGAWLAAPEAIVSERARVDGVQLVFTPKKQSAEVKA